MSSAGEGGIAAIGAALDNPQDAPTMAEAGDHTADLEQRERPPFPPGCPVTPLGIASGLDGSQVCFYLDVNGQLVGLEAGHRHGKNSLIALFGRASDWLEANFPQYSKPVYEGTGKARRMVRPSQIVGFDQAEASRALIEECSNRGIFDPAGKMRGPGAHRQRGGGMVLHCGDKLMASEHDVTTGKFKRWTWRDPGRHEDNVYTAKSPIPRPWHEPVEPEAARKFLVSLLGTWNWKRKTLDPRLVLGAIGASLIGGWLPWRPNIIVTGSRGTGKSTLNGENGVLDQLLGAGQFRTDNTSAAAIRSSLLNSTVPVMLDELEAEVDSRRVIEVIETARVSSSGGKITRSSAEQKTKEFTLRSVFWMSMINPPPLKPQDRSRLAICELKKLPKDAKPLVLADWNLPQLGRKLQRRMLDQLFRLEATKAKFHAGLQAAGHDARACDQFGWLLACADALIFDRNGAADDEEVQHWADHCRPERMAEISNEDSDDMLCLSHLMTQEVQARGGDERVTLGTWIGGGVRYAMAPLLPSDERPGDENADRRLQELGLKIVNAKWNPAANKGQGGWGTAAYNHEEPGFLAVSASHNAVKRLFAPTTWQEGNHMRALGRCENAIESVAAVKFRYSTQRAVLVPLYLVLDEDELPNASQKKAHAAWFAAWAEEYGQEG
ncbi:hypothetical protein [Aurantiacibacter zhengii]|uniref:SF3 helicase domain-containing protein n=1 Tax=Aurantiacibacter zhengii TaxID=2307003 RepID=A0A418NTS3_9SPHN|nr:hypothetical protein [Aurantiacibacter zhengii]RIV87486.1 hypothetical protein D2V07_03810 [Aurantiacibacter zhengii]